MKTSPRPLTVLVFVLPLALAGCHKSDSKAAGGAPTAALKGKLDAARAAGEPVTLGDLNAWYRTPPAGEDAGSLLGLAFEQLTKDDPKSPGFREKNQKLIPLLHDAAALGKCRYPLDLTLGVKTPTPHLLPLKSCLYLLVAEAAHQVEAGRMERAATALLDELAVARTLEAEPMLSSQLVRLAGETIGARGLEAALAKRGFPDAELVRLQAGFRAADEGSSLARALVAERSVDYACFQMPVEELGEFTAFLCKESGLAFTADELKRYHGTKTFRSDSEFVWDYLSELVAASRLPCPESLAASEAVAKRLDEARHDGFIISQLFLKSVATSLERAAVVAGQLRAAQTALAVERHRLAHSGVPPNALAELVPGFLDAIPTDPFDGKSLRYLKGADGGYVVYSIGRDRRDDHGAPEAKGVGDVAFSVRR